MIKTNPLQKAVFVGHINLHTVGVIKTNPLQKAVFVGHINLHTVRVIKTNPRQIAVFLGYISLKECYSNQTVYTVVTTTYIHVIM